MVTGKLSYNVLGGCLLGPLILIEIRTGVPAQNKDNSARSKSNNKNYVVFQYDFSTFRIFYCLR